MDVVITQSSSHMMLTSGILTLLPKQLHFFLRTHNVLYYPIKAISQGLQTFILSTLACLLITVMCTNENIQYSNFIKSFFPSPTRFKKQAVTYGIEFKEYYMLWFHLFAQLSVFTKEKYRICLEWSSVNCFNLLFRHLQCQSTAISCVMDFILRTVGLPENYELQLLHSKEVYVGEGKRQ